MLKRILLIGLFTGAGQLYSIFVLKIISNISAGKPSIQIAQLDSLFFFMLGLIAFGLQPAAIRDLALAKDWKREYNQVQSARITLGIMLSGLVIIAALNEYYLIFLLAPFVAASGEYALYARGAAVFGSFISFLRLTIPFTAILVMAFFQPEYTGWAYTLSLLMIYLLTNFLISRYLHVPFFSRPAVKELKRYIDSIPLGVVTLSQYMIGLGLLLVAPYFYKSESLGIIFAGLKFYVLYKGVLRIIHQAFVQEMTKEVFCLRVDQISMMIACLFVLSVFFFPNSFIGFVFGQQALQEKVFFQLLGLAAISYSFFLSMGTTALLQKMDRIYSIVTALAATAAVASSIILSYHMSSGMALGLSLLFGELTFMSGLIWLAPNKKPILKRLQFLGEIILLLIIPFAIGYLFGDHLAFYFISVAAVGLILLLLHHKKFRL